MKKELKEQIVEEARDPEPEMVIHDDSKIVSAPDAYWVQAWIKVPLDAIETA